MNTSIQNPPKSEHGKSVRTDPPRPTPTTQNRQIANYVPLSGRQGVPCSTIFPVWGFWGILYSGVYMTQIDQNPSKILLLQFVPGGFTPLTGLHRVSWHHPNVVNVEVKSLAIIYFRKQNLRANLFRLLRQILRADQQQFYSYICSEIMYLSTLGALILETLFCRSLKIKNRLVRSYLSHRRLLN